MTTDTTLGTVFVFAGASGSGKSTICKKLAKKDLGRLSISHTTRAQSPQETNGVEYHFISRAAFQDLLDRKQMAEWAQVHGELYGTGIAWLNEQMAQGHNVFLDIDVQGMLQLRKCVKRLCASFILPTGIDVLQQRLQQRQRDTQASIAARLRTAMREFQQVDCFDYLLVNDDLEQTFIQAQAIVHAADGDVHNDATVNSFALANQLELVRKWQKIGTDRL